MANIDLGEAQKITANDPLWAARGKAMQAYANLEQTLATFFAFLSDTSLEVALTVVFRISSSDSRNKILEKLFRLKFQQRYNLFRNSLFDQLRPIDIERNSIVHWNAVAEVGHDGKGATASLHLRPPASITTVQSPSKTTEQTRTTDSLPASSGSSVIRDSARIFDPDSSISGVTAIFWKRA